MKVATTCFPWSQPIIIHSPSSSQTLASTISSLSSTRQCHSAGVGLLVCWYVHILNRWALFGTPLIKLLKICSCEYPKSRTETIKRACSASFDVFSDEEFSKKIHELVLRFQLSDDDDDNNKINCSATNSESKIRFYSSHNHGVNGVCSFNSINNKKKFQESLSSGFCGAALRRNPAIAIELVGKGWYYSDEYWSEGKQH